MSTRAIRTISTQESCDVCGRTLLRGERAEIYLSGGSRRSVCELCTSRALQGGWVREGEVPSYDDLGSRPARRRSLLDRLLGGSRRDGPNRRGTASRRDLGIPHEFDDGGWDPADLAPTDDELDGDAPLERGRTQSNRRRLPGVAPHAPEDRDPPAGRRRTGAGSDDPEAVPRGRRAARRAPLPVPGREPRHVHAVPTSIEHRISSAVGLFNDSEHTRTISGVARSLGLPEVSVHPSDTGGGVVCVAVAWELCWYRYEADLSEELPVVRLAGQGYELSELTEAERQFNAVADERGRLHLG